MDMMEIRHRLLMQQLPRTQITWNQLVDDGNFSNETKWSPGNVNYGTKNIANNTGTWNCTAVPSQYYQTGLMHASNYLSIPYDHKVIVKAKLYSTLERNSAVSKKISIYGLIGGTHTYKYGGSISVNTWTDFIGFMQDRPADTLITRFKVCYQGSVDDVTVETTIKMQNLMAFDLTLMFGAGSEPQTASDFVQICENNGVNLDEYQPYDTGTTKMWII